MLDAHLSNPRKRQLSEGLTNQQYKTGGQVSKGKSSVIPSTQEDLPIAPSFFLAAKGPDGSAAVTKRQASHDGAMGAKGIDSLKSYGQEKPS